MELSQSFFRSVYLGLGLLSAFAVIVGLRMEGRARRNVVLGGVAVLALAVAGYFFFGVRWVVYVVAADSPLTVLVDGNEALRVDAGKTGRLKHVGLGSSPARVVAKDRAGKDVITCDVDAGLYGMSAAESVGIELLEHRYAIGGGGTFSPGRVFGGCRQLLDEVPGHVYELDEPVPTIVTTKSGTATTYEVKVVYQNAR
jgi:hypothetical protein